MKSDGTYTPSMPFNSPPNLTSLPHLNCCTSYNPSPLPIQNSFYSFNPWLIAPVDPLNLNLSTIHPADQPYKHPRLSSNVSTSRNHYTYYSASPEAVYY